MCPPWVCQCLFRPDLSCSAHGRGCWWTFPVLLLGVHHSVRDASLTRLSLSSWNLLTVAEGGLQFCHPSLREMWSDSDLRDVGCLLCINAQLWSIDILLIGFENWKQCKKKDAPTLLRDFERQTQRAKWGWGIIYLFIFCLGGFYSLIRFHVCYFAASQFHVCSVNFLRVADEKAGVFN